MAKCPFDLLLRAPRIKRPCGISVGKRRFGHLSLTVRPSCLCNLPRNTTILTLSQRSICLRPLGTVVLLSFSDFAQPCGNLLFQHCCWSSHLKRPPRSKQVLFRPLRIHMRAYIQTSQTDTGHFSMHRFGSFRLLLPVSPTDPLGKGLSFLSNHPTEPYKGPRIAYGMYHPLVLLVCLSNFRFPSESRGSHHHTSSKSAPLFVR